MVLEMVKIHQEAHGDLKFQISWIIYIGKPEVGVKSDSWVRRWSGSIRKDMEIPSFKFHRDWTLGTQVKITPILHLWVWSQGERWSQRHVLSLEMSQGSWEVSKMVSHLFLGPLEVPEKFSGGWHMRLYGWHKRLYGGLLENRVYLSP